MVEFQGSGSKIALAERLRQGLDLDRGPNRYGIASPQTPAGFSASPLPHPPSPSPNTNLPRPSADASDQLLAVWLAQRVEAEAGLRAEARVHDKIIDALQAEPHWRSLARLPERDFATSPDFLALLEKLTTHETYLFRDPRQLDFFRTEVLIPLLRERSRTASPHVTLWSAACSTGEEVYTLAIMVLEELAALGEAPLSSEGIPVPLARWRIEILGSDLSRAVVTLAERARYREITLGPFRAMAPRHFAFFQRLPEVPGSHIALWEPKPGLRRMVHFGRNNLLQGEPPILGADAVFCRNVLIYFDRPAKRRAVSEVHAALAPHGFAVFGPSDIPEDPSLFQAKWGPMAVIYQCRA